MGMLSDALGRKRVLVGAVLTTIAAVFIGVGVLVVLRRPTERTALLFAAVLALAEHRAAGVAGRFAAARELHGEFARLNFEERAAQAA